MTLGLEEAVERARSLEGRMGYAGDVEGGRTVVIARTVGDLLAANAKGNLVVVDPFLPKDTFWTLPSSALWLADDFTLDAPADNVILEGGYFRPGSNSVIRGIGFGAAPTDGVWFDPAQKGHGWVDRCRFIGPFGDGALDVQSSAVTNATPERYYTFSRNTFIGCNKTMLISALTATEPKIFATMAHNRLIGCIQRLPRLAGGVIGHVAYNRMEMPADMVNGICITDGATGIAEFNTFTGGTPGQQAVETGSGGRYIDRGGNDYGGLAVELEGVTQTVEAILAAGSRP